MAKTIGISQDNQTISSIATEGPVIKNMLLVSPQLYHQQHSVFIA